MPRRLFCVDLFSGTGSIGRAARAVGAQRGLEVRVLSVDSDPASRAVVCADIGTWRYRPALRAFLAERRPEDVVWVHASPPCTEYSRSKTNSPRNLPAADHLVRRALTIIAYVRPTWWTLENPLGLLRTRRFMAPLRRWRHTTSYCHFGRPFRKDTDIWTNVPVELPLCRVGSYCAARARLGRHPSPAENRAHVYSDGRASGGTPRALLYALPQRLIRTIIRAALDQYRAV